MVLFFGLVFSVGPPGNFSAEALVLGVFHDESSFMSTVQIERSAFFENFLP